MDVRVDICVYVLAMMPRCRLGPEFHAIVLSEEMTAASERESELESTQSQ